MDRGEHVAAGVEHQLADDARLLAGDRSVLQQRVVHDVAGQEDASGRRRGHRSRHP